MLEKYDIKSLNITFSTFPGLVIMKKSEFRIIALG